VSKTEDGVNAKLEELENVKKEISLLLGEASQHEKTAQELRLQAKKLTSEVEGTYEKIFRVLQESPAGKRTSAKKPDTVFQFQENLRKTADELAESSGWFSCLALSTRMLDGNLVPTGMTERQLTAHCRNHLKSLVLSKKLETTSEGSLRLYRKIPTMGSLSTPLSEEASRSDQILCACKTLEENGSKVTNRAIRLQLLSEGAEVSQKNISSLVFFLRKKKLLSIRKKSGKETIYQLTQEGKKRTENHCPDSREKKGRRKRPRHSSKRRRAVSHPLYGKKKG